jgi:hypothetical protein
MAHSQTPWLIQLCVQKVKIAEGWRVGACSMACSTRVIDGHVGAPGWGLGRVTSKSITHTYLHNQTTSWLVHSWNIFGAWMSHKQKRNHDSPWPELGGNHNLPPYCIICAWSWGQHPNVILSQDSQIRVLKFSKLGLSQFWRPITLGENLQL